MFRHSRLLTGLVLATAVLAQSSPQYLISTLAGGGRLPFPAAGYVANQARFILPVSIVTDAGGNVYVSDSYYDRVLRISPSGAVTSYAGSETGLGGDGGAPAAARFNGVSGLAISPSGELYVCDLRNFRVRRVSRDGLTISTFAGNGSLTRSGDGGPATEAGIGNPRGIAVDGAGNVYISDSFNHLVRKVDAGGMISTVAGTGRPGFSGDGGAATAAQLQSPAGLAVDAQNNLYIADSTNNRIRRVVQGRIETFAGTGVGGGAGENVAPTAAQLSAPSDVAVNKNGDVFISDRNNGRVRRVRANRITLVAGGGTSRSLPGPATTYDLGLPISVAVDANEQLLVLDDAQRRVYRVNLASNVMQAVAGIPAASAAGDNGPATDAVLFQPHSVAVDAEGNVFASDVVDNRIRRVSAKDGTITTFAGTGALGQPGPGETAKVAEFGRPRDLAMDRNQNLYVSSTWGAYLFRITPAGAVTQLAGGPTVGFAGDGQTTPYTSRLNIPIGVTVDRNDNIYIADSANHRVRKLDASGLITTVAGTGEAGFAGDGGPAIGARLSTPRGVAVDAAGNLFIADSLNHRVRRVDPQGVITTVAGTGETGLGGAGKPGLEAQLWTPSDLAFDSFGSLLIAITGHGQIRSLSPDGIISVVAGSANTGFSGDGGLATDARLATPTGISVAADGSIYIAEQNSERIRKLSLVRLTAAGVLNQASRQGGAVAPNEIVVIQGLGLGPAEEVKAQPDESGRYPKTLAETEVLFDGAPAPLFSVQDRVVVAAVPSSVADKVRLRVSYQGRPTEEVTLAVAPSAPGVFVTGQEGRGPASVRNEDGTGNAEDTPAPAGSVVSFLVNGAGSTSPVIDDGAVATDVVQPALPVEVQIGGAVAELVSISVPAGQTAGTMEVKARVPQGLTTGAADLVIRAGEAVSQPGVILFVSTP